MAVVTRRVYEIAKDYKVSSHAMLKIVQDLNVSEFSRGRMEATETELREERAAIEHLL